MTACCQRSQALVEFALLAPVLIVLAMCVWDGGSVLREQVVLQQAARDGARVAATAYGPTVPRSTIADAVIASARDLPALSSSPGYLTISYPNARSVQVQLTFAHSLITPVLRQAWAGGQGTITLQASATFYLAQLTPVPPTLIAATPTATPVPTNTPTLISTPTATATLTSTPTLPRTPTSTATPLTCNPAVAIPALDNSQGQGNSSGSGFYVVIQLNAPSYIDAVWTQPAGNGENMQLFVYANSPTDHFTGQPNPTSLPPPSGALISMASTANSIHVRTPQTNLTGSYTVYFFDLDSGLAQTTAGRLQYLKYGCP